MMKAARREGLPLMENSHNLNPYWFSVDDYALNHFLIGKRLGYFRRYAQRLAQ